MLKIVISNLAQFHGIAVKHPEILNIGAFSLFRDIFSKLTGKCNCNKNKELIAYRPQFETAFVVLTQADKDRMKSLLNATDLCYYIKEANGQLKLNCF